MKLTQVIHILKDGVLSEKEALFHPYSNLITDEQIRKELEEYYQNKAKIIIGQFLTENNLYDLKEELNKH